MKPEYLVFVLITFDILIGIYYGVTGDVPRLGYWFSAASISGFSVLMK